MILSAQAIRVRCLQSAMVSPFHERTTVNGMTFGLSAAGYDIRCAEWCFLPAGFFILASSMERFNMPLDVLAIVHDKSTWARRGLAVQNTVFEPGWRGYPTLELSNHGDRRLEVQAGDPIAQIVFHLLTEATEQPYQGKYQDQPAGPQPAKETFT